MRPVRASLIPGRSSSIAKRLAWFYTLASSLLLIFASVFLYWVLGVTLEKEDERMLANQIHELKTILQTQHGCAKALEREVTHGNAGMTSFQYHIYSRILDDVGRTLVESPGMEGEIPPLAFPATNSTPYTSLKWRSASGKTYLLAASPADAGGTDRTLRQIQVALDGSLEDALISRYERYLMVVLLIGIVASAVIGIVAARRGMQPLTDITKAIERITASQLHERINAVQWPQELVVLASAFDGMLDRLEDAFNRLSQFSADLAHELRTPINNLRGEAEVAMSRPRGASEYRDILASSLEEYERLSRMTDSLLFLAKADSTQTSPNFLPVDAGKEVAKIINFYEALAADQGVHVLCEGNETVQADPTLFHRAISNLLSNALHYTPRGGKIVFSIQHETNGTIQVVCSDTGIGIAPEHLPRIFDRFYRIDSSRHGHAEGTGLGLSIVKSIMHLHRGDLTVTSVVGEGTSFRLIFSAAT